MLLRLQDMGIRSVEVLEGMWCGGWDLNPRRPTPAGLEPAPFDLARAPPLPAGLAAEGGWSRKTQGSWPAPRLLA